MSKEIQPTESNVVALFRAHEERYQEQLRVIGTKEARIKELEESLDGILSIGKRDMTNPKYDGYFEAARKVLAKGNRSNTK